MVDSELILRGDKVKLRPFSISDVDDAYIGWLNDPDVVRYSNQRFMKHDRGSCLRYLASFEGTQNLFMSVRRLADDCQIGTLTAYASSHHGTADVGIMMGDKSVWGAGYGQDAWNTLMNWLSARGVRKITAGTLACNFGMIKVMERSGMVPDGVRKAQEIVDGRPVDILYYAKFNVS